YIIISFGFNQVDFMSRILIINCDDINTGLIGSFNTYQRIFNNYTVLSRKFKMLECIQIDFWMRLNILDIFSRPDHRKIMFKTKFAINILIIFLIALNIG